MFAFLLIALLAVNVSGFSIYESDYYESGSCSYQPSDRRFGDNFSVGEMRDLTIQCRANQTRDLLREIGSFIEDNARDGHCFANGTISRDRYPIEVVRNTTRILRARGFGVQMAEIHMNFTFFFDPSRYQLNYTWCPVE